LELTDAEETAGEVRIAAGVGGDGGGGLPPHHLHHPGRHHALRHFRVPGIPHRSHTREPIKETKRVIRKKPAVTEDQLN